MSDVSSALSSIHSEVFLDDLASLLSNTELRLSDIIIQATREVEWLKARPNRFYDLIDVSRVLHAMLEVSYGVSANSQLYTSCAIAACHRGEGEQREKMLMELGEAWITHFLFPCRLPPIMRFSPA